MRKKGLSTGVMMALFFIAILVTAGIVLSISGVLEKKPQRITPIEYDGSFATYRPIQGLSGYNDLSVTEQSLTDSANVVNDANSVAKFNVNTSDGDVLRFAYGLEIDGPMEEVDLEMVNEGVDSNLDVRSVKLVKDEDDELSIDTAPVVKEFSVDSDDEVDGTVGVVEEGDYLVVMEVRGVDTGAITSDQDLYTFDLDATTDADSDEAEEMHVTIDNA